MNNALTLILIVTILALGTVFAMKNRYTVIQDTQHGTLLIDNWDVMHARVIERKSDGNWKTNDIDVGKIEMHADMSAPEPTNEMGGKNRPAI